MKVSRTLFWLGFVNLCIAMPLLSSCSLVVAIGKEDPEISDYDPETDPENDPLTVASNPKHPLLRYQDERAGNSLKSPWAEKALRAREAQSLISTGNYFSCAQNSAGELKCWGFAVNGSTGKDSSGTDTTNYFDAYENNLRKIAISKGSSCILTYDYSLQCHGANDLIGIDTKENSFTPVAPTGLSKARDIDAKDYNTCAITSNGSLKCWGWSFGKTPTEVAGTLKNLLRVTIGTNHHCVIDSNFKALCWGSNSKGQLGLDPEKTTTKSAPVYVENLPQGVIHTAVGSEHTCALLESGSVQCWGSNEKGQLGNGGTENSSVPVQVTGLDSGVIAIDSGDAHTCALKDDGSVYCWGDNDKGELGNGNNEQQSAPAQVSGLANAITQMSAGPEHTCVLDADKVAWCWGQGSIFDLLGDGKREDSSVPVQVSNFVPSEE